MTGVCDAEHPGENFGDFHTHGAGSYPVSFPQWMPWSGLFPVRKRPPLVHRTSI
ncbi:unnamed protein product [[Actinomadura] parvosata subsp. kistnae]|nr:unnamed protein product [Actinomadura parvosata subsp. kistnae]